MTDMRRRWYPHGVKAVPGDLVLEPIGLMAWYLGDGSLIRQSHGVAAYLYTNNFSFEEADLLQGILWDNFGVGVSIHHRRPGDGGWSSAPNQDAPVLYVPQRNTPRLFEIMGACPIPCMKQLKRSIRSY